MTQKYYIPLTIIVSVQNGYLDNEDLKEVGKVLRYESRWMIDEIDQVSDAVQESLPDGIELVHLGVEEPIGM